MFKVWVLKDFLQEKIIKTGREDIEIVLTLLPSVFTDLALRVIFFQSF